VKGHDFLGASWNVLAATDAEMKDGGVFIAGSRCRGLMLRRPSPSAMGLEAWRPSPKGAAQS